MGGTVERMKRVMMSGAASVTVIATALLVLGSCSAPAPIPTASPSQPLATEVDTADPTVLVGQWRVTSADGTGPDSWLRLGVELDVWSDCGHASGSWRAVGAAFLASVYGSSFPAGSTGDPYSCLDEPRFGQPSASLRWLWSAASYEVLDDGIALTDVDGELVALLVDDGSSPPSENALDPRPPVLTPELAEHLAAPAALPGGVMPIRDLVGRWLPTDRTEQSDTAFLEFREDGAWSGSDGCNSGSGRWVSGDASLFMATRGPQTMAGCENSNAMGWLHGVTRAGTIGEELVLFNSAGERLGSLVREDPFDL